jgi:hypothetical protein
MRGWQTTMKSRIRVASLIGAGIVTAVALLPSTAWASKFTPNRTVYDAGYYAGPGGISVANSASADIVLPKVKCAAGQTAAIDPLVEVYGSPSSSAGGLQAGVRLVCTNGVASYQAQFLINGTRTFPALNVAKGNEIAESVSETATAGTATLTDVTTGQTVSASGASTQDDTYAAVEMVCVNTTPTSSVCQAVAPFGHVSFTNAAINGQPLGSLNWGADNMYSGSSNPPGPNASLLIKTTKISGSTFKSHFVQSTGSASPIRAAIKTNSSSAG